MAAPLLIVVTGIYAYVATSFALGGHWPMAIVYFGYAVANCGLMVVSP
jgi:fatty acid desaturase